MNIFDKAPIVDKDAFVAPSASVIGDVQVGRGSSIWYGCVLRGKIYETCCTLYDAFNFILLIRLGLKPKIHTHITFPFLIYRRYNDAHFWNLLIAHF